MEKTRNEMNQLMDALRQTYTDVRLLDAETIEKIEEGARTDPHGEELCSACRHKAQMSKHCAAKAALASKSEQCRLEYYPPDVTAITARYYEVDGQPCVLELIQRLHGDNLMDQEDGEHLVSEISGHSTHLYHDLLTGAYNRRYYEDVVRSTIGPAGVAVLDLDDFKVNNDAYGHHAGDLALEATAQAVRSCIRQTDTLVRFGGDEFLLILPRVPADLLQKKLEEIRAKVAETTVPGYAHLHLSVSIGGVMQTIADPIEVAVRRADQMMTQAKNEKNAVVLDRAGQSPLLGDVVLTPQGKPQVLIIDDSEMNRAMLSEILSRDYRVLEAANGEEGLQQLQQYAGDVAVVLLDVNMPIMGGFEVLDYMTRNHSIEDVPVIMISSDDSDDAIRQAYERGATDYINRPFDGKVVYRRVYNTINLYAKQRRLVKMVTEQVRKQEHNTTMLVGVLSQIVEFRNGESGLHVQHIRTLTELILERVMEKTSRYKLPPSEVDNIALASALHDIGKIAIDEKILNKPGRLTAEEFEVIKQHTTCGAEMLHKLENFAQEPLLQNAYVIARWHHERWDGRGYPDGLKGDEIPISAQIVALADVYDALTSERCYKKAYPHEKAIQMILNGECGAFNPLLLECLTDIESVLRQQLGH